MSFAPDIQSNVNSGLKKLITGLGCASGSALSQNMLGIVCQLFCLGQQAQRRDYLGISFRTDAQTFLLAKLGNEELGLDLRLDPVKTFIDLGFRVRNLLCVQELPEVLQDSIGNLEILVNAAAIQVVRGEIEERIFLQQRVFKARGFDGRNLYIRSDASAPKYRASAVCEPHLFVGRILFLIAIVIVIIQRDAGIIALDQASAGGVVLGSGQCQSGILGKRVDGLDKALAKGGFTRNQATIMVLNGAGDNLRRGSCSAIYQHDQGIILARIAAVRAINSLR